MPDPSIDTDGLKAAEIAYKKLQRELNKRKAGLEKVALRLKQGLSAKQTRLAQDKGKFTDWKHLTDYGTRATYCKLVIDIFGATAPQKHELTGVDGEPLIVNLKWPSNGDSESA